MLEKRRATSILIENKNKIHIHALIVKTVWGWLLLVIQLPGNKDNVK